MLRTRSLRLEFGITWRRKTDPALGLLYPFSRILEAAKIEKQMQKKMVSTNCLFKREM